MLIKGEKYACEACVRGHRASNCWHADRPLRRINKKGRPASQCTYCRTIRKSRNTHVRCDCEGEKADTEGVFIHAGISQGEPGCDLDDASRSSALGSNIRRNRALTIQSEGGLAVFTNGYHIPMCKHNNMENKRGSMHVVPYAHSIHSPYPPGVANRSVDNLPHPSIIPKLGSELHIKDSTVTAQQEQRMVKSNDGPPFLTPVSHRYRMDRFLPPLDLSNPHASVSGCFGPSWAASCPVSGRFIASGPLNLLESKSKPEQGY